MHSTARIVSVIIFGIAMTFCLTLCSFPEILTLPKANAGHCHEEGDQQNESGDSCCSGQAILPMVQGHYFPDVVQDWTHQVVIPARTNISHHEFDFTRDLLIFDSLRVTVLRI